MTVSYTHLDVYKRQVVETYEEYKKSAEALQEAKELLMEDDKEIKEMAKMEIEELEPKICLLYTSLYVLWDQLVL